MPIEFTCPNCQKLLRVAESAAGKRARCPDCATVTEVPRAAIPNMPASDFPGFGAPEPAVKNDASWSTGKWSSEAGPAGEDPAANPFSAPVAGHKSSPPLSLPEIRSRLAGPAICLMVTGGITAAITAIYFLIMIVAIIAGAADGNAEGPAELILGGLIVIAYLMVPLVRAGLIIYGAVQMKKMQRYPFALTAAILAVIPVCGCLDLPFGIWALVVLLNDQVKRGFDATTR
jgi:hypothetical protein